ncbi:MAG: S-layer homology domain-containing protein [Acidimicrobiaceae bacterium]|nr:S-layer homology domain-containing protein [Acidimicrobiaceae bacterium]MYH43816.1 S-layer homology domain-containing protein [Acidimicrobiaceae bacterium]
MATLLARALDLPVPEGLAGFADVDAAGVHAPGIEALFAAGITTGCAAAPARFCPQGLVTRAEMATLLARALDLPAA